jgi:transketolase
LIPIEPIEEKFEAFGWATARINGHNFEQMEETFAKLPFVEGKPNVIIADTVRGKGLPSIEKRADRWFVNFTHEEIESLLKELHGEAKAELTSETLVVR